MAAKEIEPAQLTFPFYFPGGQIEQASEQTSAPGVSQKKKLGEVGSGWRREWPKKKKGRSGEVRNCPNPSPCSFYFRDDFRTRLQFRFLRVLLEIKRLGMMNKDEV